MSQVEPSICSFCLKSESEVILFDTTINSVVIDNKYYEFSTIFQDLLNFKTYSKFICENCKEQFLTFFIFKRTIKLPTNPNKFIFSQINDFLNQKEISLDKLKVIRTIDSITLQHDDPMIKLATIKDQEENDYEIIQFSEDPYNCKYCGKIEASEIDLEIHEFLKHTSFGHQIEVEIEASYEVNSSISQCSLCPSQFEDSDNLLYHFLEDHSTELIVQMNMTSTVNTKRILKYINYIKKCLTTGATNDLPQIDDDRNYFKSIFGIEEQVMNEEALDDFDRIEIVTEEAFDENIQEQSDIEMSENYEINQPKSDKKEFSNEDKEWLRNEVNRGKLKIEEQTGSKGVAYRCMVTKNCSYVSNSKPGLRYHLVVKHLNQRNNLTDEDKNHDEKINDTTMKFLQGNNGPKNRCDDCALKFKDHRLFDLHKNCHELFSVIAQHITFPICNTCNIKFIDEESLSAHLREHDVKGNIREAVHVPVGAVRDHGTLLNKFAVGIKHMYPGETNESEFSWKCGHCAGLINFTNEEYCNFHLIMTHVSCFTCPIDLMTFKGFKSVSLFIHHLRNKHKELFPNVSFKCKFCGNEFSSIYDKLQHMKNCDAKRFSCDHCNKRFFKKGELSAHLKLVTGEIQYECEICLKKCLSQSDLKIHLRSHTKIKPYKCSQCTKSFRTLAARSNHVESHNSSENYVCDFCNKTFKQRQMYRRHVKTIHETKSLK